MKITLINIEVTPLAEGGYMANCPEVPGLRAFGETISKAVENIQGVAESWVKSCRKHGEPVPAALQPQEMEKAEFDLLVEVNLDKSVEAA